MTPLFLDSLLAELESLVIVSFPGSLDDRRSQAIDVIKDAALARGLTTLFVSLEMPILEVADRLLCSAAKISLFQLQNGISIPDELAEIAATIAGAPLAIHATEMRNIAEIANAAAILKRDRDLRLLVVDDLDLMRHPDFLRAIKQLGQEHRVPVVCFCEVSIANARFATDAENQPKEI